jgi:hypothetical protein
MTTVKTIKLKRTSQAYGEPTAPADLQPPTPPETPPAEPTRGTAPLPPDPEPKQKKTKVQKPAAPKAAPGKFTAVFMLIALLATIGLLTILGLQYSEKQFYLTPPSAWATGK